MFLAADKLKTIKREIAYRQRVYPRLVETGKMTQKIADRETRIMEEIAADYHELTKKERLL